MSDELIKRLRHLDTCAVSDALDRLGIPRGVVLGVRSQSVRRRIAGRAVTVQLELNTPELQADLAARGQKPRHLCTAAVDASGPDDVIVIANGGRTNVAGWGGTLSLGAQVRAVEGVVVDGAVRDADEAIDLSFAVYATTSVPTTARGRIVEVAWDVPITFADLTVTPGDLVLADSSGVVFLSADRAEEVITAAEDIAARERAMADAVRARRPMAEVMGANYERLLERA